MEPSMIEPGPAGTVFGRWRRMSFFRKSVALLLVAGLTGWGAFAAFRWWTAWPSRAVLVREGGHLPQSFSPDGTILVTRPLDGKSLELWAPATGKARGTWPESSPRVRFQGLFSPDGLTYASAWYVGTRQASFSVDLIDVGTGRVRSTFASPLLGLLGLGFREGGKVVRLVASGARGRAVVDVDVASGAVISTKKPSLSSGAERAAVSPDGRWLARVDYGGTPAVLTVWDLDRDREAVDLAGATRGMNASAMAFSADSRKLAVGYDDGSVEVWDLDSKSLQQTLRGHSPNYGPRTLTFSPDGSTIASMANFNKHVISFDLLKVFFASMSGDKDRVMQTELVLMDVPSGHRLVFAKDARAVAFAPDGQTIAASHEDGTVRLHDVPKPP